MSNENPSPRTILHIFGRMVRGGAEIRTIELMRSIDPSQFKFEFCVLSGLPGELDEEILQLGGDIHFLKIGPDFPFKFRRLLQKKRFHTVHSHVFMASGLMLLLAAWEKVPVRVAHFRSTNDGKKNTLARRCKTMVMKYFLNRYASKIVSVSEAAMVSAWGTDWTFDSRCEVIYNGFDLSPFKGKPVPKEVRREFGLPEPCRLYIHVGRMTPAKNHRKLLAVFQQIGRLDPNARLLVVGREDNQMGEELRQQALALGVDGRVVFAGEREDVPRLLKAADLMLFPSLWEGLPGAVVESCAAGTPVLASHLAGIVEIKSVLDGLITCLPVDAPDQVWASTASEICAKPSQNFREEALDRIADSPFDLDNCKRKLLEIWSH